MTIEIHNISAVQTHELRQSILRPHQDLNDMVYEGDEASTSLHWGLFSDGKLIGIASVYAETNDYCPPAPRSWRLRGMAVAVSQQGKGYGGRLLQAAQAALEKKGPGLLWCNAREQACGFYRQLGFEAVSPRFDIEGIGPHFVLCKTWS